MTSKDLMSEEAGMPRKPRPFYGPPFGSGDHGGAEAMVLPELKRLCHEAASSTLAAYPH